MILLPVLRGIMKINRKKIETEKWIVRRYTYFLDEDRRIHTEFIFAEPNFKGYPKSHWMKARLREQRAYNYRKIRQCRLILDKLGIKYQ
jgi:hypothetical protein